MYRIGMLKTTKCGLKKLKEHTAQSQAAGAITCSTNMKR